METLPSYMTGFLSVLLFSAFVKIFTTLNILRFGMGLRDAGFGLVILVLSLALAVLITGSGVKGVGFDNLLSGKGLGDGKKVEEALGPFLEKHTHPEVKERLRKISDKFTDKDVEIQKENFSLLASAFLISELKEAFQLGFIFIVPFLIIDLLVANVLLSIGVSQISAAVVALPVKLLLFIVVDGWSLVSEKLIGGYLI